MIYAMGREIELKIPLTNEQYDSFFQTFYAPNHPVSPFDSIQILDSSAEQTIKEDEFFSKYDSMEERIAHNEPTVIRLRTEKTLKTPTTAAPSKVFFTIKQKNRKDGFEINREDETYVENAEVLRLFMETAGYHCWFKKVKTAFSCHCTLKNKGVTLTQPLRLSHSESQSQSTLPLVFHVELVSVNSLKYIEIEVTSQDAQATSITSALAVFVKKMGLRPEDKDPRSWYEIINGV